jgi:hypothetical protein
MLGWRVAVLSLAGILAAITIPPHALLLCRRPQDLGLLPNGAPAYRLATQYPATAERSVSARSALCEADFWWLTFAVAVNTFAAVAKGVHLIPYLIDRARHSPSFAATVASLFGLMSLAGRLLIGPLG